MTDDLMALKPSDVHLIATNPSEMEAAQHQLVSWCEHKIAEWRANRNDAIENREIAKRSKWKSTPWQRRVRDAQKRLTFYQKILAALKAGYYIVPPFPVQTFAVRTERASPKKRYSTYRWGPHHVPDEEAQALPQGDGDYVSPDQECWPRDANFGAKDKEGNAIVETGWYPRLLLQVDFPVSLVKPKVLDATTKAMALKIFDQMGILPARARNKDPIVLGQIIDPRPGREPITFFVTWWLNTEDL